MGETLLDASSLKGQRGGNKRVACPVCRSKKYKCDGSLPGCAKRALPHPAAPPPVALAPKGPEDFFDAPTTSAPAPAPFLPVQPAAAAAYGTMTLGVPTDMQQQQLPSLRDMTAILPQPAQPSSTQQQRRRSPGSALPPKAALKNKRAAAFDEGGSGGLAHASSVVEMVPAVSLAGSRNIISPPALDSFQVTKRAKHRHGEDDRTAAAAAAVAALHPTPTNTPGSATSGPFSALTTPNLDFFLPTPTFRDALNPLTAMLDQISVSFALENDLLKQRSGNLITDGGSDSMAVDRIAMNMIPVSFVLLGMAARMACYLKLYEEPDNNPALRDNLTWEEKECRRRLWWSTFFIDRMVGVMSGLPSFLSDACIESATVRPVCDNAVFMALHPLDIGLDPEPQPDSGLHRLNQLVAIGAKVQQAVGLKPMQSLEELEEIRPQLVSIEAELTELYEALPPSLADFPSELYLHEAFSIDDDTFMQMMARAAAMENSVDLDSSPAPPDTTRIGRGDAWDFMFIHAFYNTLILLVHRPRLLLYAGLYRLPRRHSDEARMLQRSIERTERAAGCIVTLAERILRAGVSFSQHPNALLSGATDVPTWDDIFTALNRSSTFLGVEPDVQPISSANRTKKRTAHDDGVTPPASIAPTQSLLAVHAKAMGKGPAARPPLPSRQPDRMVAEVDSHPFMGFSLMLASMSLGDLASLQRRLHPADSPELPAYLSHCHAAISLMRRFLKSVTCFYHVSEEYLEASADLLETVVSTAKAAPVVDEQQQSPTSGVSGQPPSSSTALPTPESALSSPTDPSGTNEGRKYYYPRDAITRHRQRAQGELDEITERSQRGLSGGSSAKPLPPIRDTAFPDARWADRLCGVDVAKESRKARQQLGLGASANAFALGRGAGDSPATTVSASVTPLVGGASQSLQSPWFGSQSSGSTSTAPTPVVTIGGGAGTGAVPAPVQGGSPGSGMKGGQRAAAFLTPAVFTNIGEGDAGKVGTGPSSSPDLDALIREVLGGSY
ncbi:hypothetical protein HDU96_004641 [Phlyctochytrium bullatum]|nr:hypothetical protein HDU96_004641 [Phlyctochytrium bullatum]